MDILVTGAAGFIGFHLCQRLLAEGNTVVGLDNLNDYYDVDLKKARLLKLEEYEDFFFYPQDIAESSGVDRIFKAHMPPIVVHLAAQAGVRYSIENPDAYVQSNLVGFANILEACRRVKVTHFVYASSSSVYGNRQKVPFLETDSVDHPISLYAATKKSNELMAHTYSHLYKIPTTGLRFFTVYGPWGRPDMAYFKFAKSIVANQSIDIFNNGDMSRDFTYIDDVIEGIVGIIAVPKSADGEVAPYQLLNIGRGHPVQLLEFVSLLKDALGISGDVKMNSKPMQSGDVKLTYADVERLNHLINYRPTTSLKIGLQHFADWFKTYYKG